MSHRAALLASWRDFVELLRRLPPDLAAARKADAVSQIRAGAAAAAGATGTPPDASADGLKRLMAAVATLRATTARVPGERRGGRGGVYVLREGRLVREDGGGDRGASTSRCVFFFSFFSSPSSRPASVRACAATLSRLISLFPHLSLQLHRRRPPVRRRGGRPAPGPDEAPVLWAGPAAGEAAILEKERERREGRGRVFSLSLSSPIVENDRGGPRDWKQASIAGSNRHTQGQAGRKKQARTHTHRHTHTLKKADRKSTHTEIKKSHSRHS